MDMEKFVSDIVHLKIINHFIFTLKFYFYSTIGAARKKGMLTLPEHMIPLMFCKEVGGFQAVVHFVFVLSLSLFQICFVSLIFALKIYHMGILHWTLKIRTQIINICSNLQTIGTS